MNRQNYCYNFFLFAPLGYIWFVSSLAETNRRPYDFAEGESELVSGFNTEYGSGGFTLIFIAEYASILLIRILFSVMFISRTFRYFRIIKRVIVAFCFVWVRATLPRYRYDKLIGLA
jgi:NADH-ubiquinone oxidoreductase chain 1